MTRATLHVLSRGPAPEHDYRWVAVEPPGSEPRPPCLDENSAHLLQSEHPSLLMLRRGGELLLFATSFDSSRVDVQGRAIRSALAVTVPEVDEARLRGLAATVLQDEDRQEMESLLDEAIFDRPEGDFDVSGGLLGRVLALAQPCEDQSPDLRRRFGPNGSEERSELAAELTRCRLPLGEGPLVVVTGALSQERLSASPAWRGLTRLVARTFEAPARETQPPSKKGRSGLRGKLLLLLLTGAAVVLLSKIARDWAGGV